MQISRKFDPNLPAARRTTGKGAHDMETEETLSNVWDQHVVAEFSTKSADEAVATMTAEPYVGHSDRTLPRGRCMTRS
jgi:hypothetical protein